MAAMSALAIGAAMGFMQIAGSYSKSKAEELQGDWEKSLNEHNARLAEMDSQDALERGERDATELKRQSKRLIGSQRVALAAQGLELDDGTALQLQTDTAEQAELDAITTRNNAWREAWGYRAQAQESRNRGAMAYSAAMTGARNTMISGYTAAAGSFAEGYYKSPDSIRNPGRTVPTGSPRYGS